MEARAAAVPMKPKKAAEVGQTFSVIESTTFMVRQKLLEGAVATYTQAASAEERQIGYRKRAGAGGAQPACNHARSELLYPEACLAIDLSEVESESGHRLLQGELWGNKTAGN